eukprot:CAMPEP_0115717116 /NCGR_PEP_ID=MMETSP0272-20121206/76695_1 /TAXON_ID=71861 /ORGANISM="Scrippsiella trochoidea, Strain CCMP3099" /LENGTH=123 /DNA_ID=CAMNT_0003159495 /DNA_START=95 /DNA_END=463 /DNA_ORIENTATION=-
MPVRHKKTDAPVMTLQTVCTNGLHVPGKWRSKAPKSKAWYRSAASTRIITVATFRAMTTMIVTTDGKSEAPAIAHGKLKMPTPKPAVMRLAVTAASDTLGPWCTALCLSPSAFPTGCPVDPSL